MSKFTSAKRINTRWRNNDFIGEPGSSHTFPDAFHEEFLVDWAYQIQIGDITITETPTTGNIQMSTLTVGDIVVTGTATGNFGSQATVVQGTAPISVSTSSNTATVSLNANYSTSTHTHTSFANNLQINKADSKVQLLNTTSGSGTEDGMYLLMADTDVGYLWNAETNGALVFGTGGAERVHITPAGKFGIGTSTPAHQLEVVGPQSVTVGLSAGGAGFAELELVGHAGKNYITSDDTLSFDIGGTERATIATTGLNVTSGTLSQGGTAVSLSTHTHAYQPVGTYVTSVTGTAPIAVSTTTDGIASVSLNASYSTDTHTHTLPPTGSILMWATTSAPTGWLFCDGTSYAYNTYPTLGALFGGVAGGNFNVPDLRDRFIAGASAISAATNNAGTFAPNTSNIHTHTTDIAHGHADTIAVSTHGDHTHAVNPASTASGGPSGTTSVVLFTGSGTSVGVGSSGHTHSTDIASTTSGAESTNLTHTVTGGVTSLGATLVTSSNGSLLPKAALLNFIIKA